MIIGFVISVVVVGILGSLLIYNCKASKERMRDGLQAEINKLEKTYAEDGVRISEDLSKLKTTLSELKKQYSSKKGGKGFIS